MITGKNITDEQIRKLRLAYFHDHSTIDVAALGLSSSSMLDVFDVALWPSKTNGRAWLTPDEARARCAEILNARAASKDGAK